MTLPTTAYRIDAHQHFWHYNPQEYAWIADNLEGTQETSMQPIARDFLPEDLAPLLDTSGISSCIAVEARQSVMETHWLLSLAAKNSFLIGVVGWAPIAAPEFPDLLASLQQHKHLVGLRHGIQSEPDPLFLRHDDFNAGFRHIAGTPLVFDLLLLAHQLEEAIHFVDRHPNQSFVLDHCAKPPIAASQETGEAALRDWQKHFRQLALRPNVACKLSGLVNEAIWSSWVKADLDPIWQTALEAFGPSRLLFGSDWPVATLASSYARWVETVEAWLSPLSLTEQFAIWGGNAMRLYGLSA